MKVMVSGGYNMDHLIRTLEEFEGNVTYTLSKREGFHATFTVEGNINQDLAVLTKQIIRATPIGKNLLFQIQIIE